MNTDTNQVYWNAADVKAAQDRGEPLMPLIPVIAQPTRNPELTMFTGTRKERRAQASEARKAAKRKRLAATTGAADQEQT
jgi:hypothetical protein